MNTTMQTILCCLILIPDEFQKEFFQSVSFLSHLIVQEPGFRFRAARIRIDTFYEAKNK